MNKAELNSVFDRMEPSDRQKQKMLNQIIHSDNITYKKTNSRLNKILGIAASLVLILCITGTTAYATGLIDKVLGGYFVIEDNFVSWATNEDFLTHSHDKVPDITTKNYDEIYSYDTIEEALQKHNLNITTPQSKLLSYDSNGVSVKISNANPVMTEINFFANYNLSDGTVELQACYYKIAPNQKFGLSTSVHADKAKTSKYLSKSGTEYTLLETNDNGQPQSVANIMIHTVDNQTYYYCILFTNVSKHDIENILDSFDMSIYVTE